MDVLSNRRLVIVLLVLSLCLPTWIWRGLYDSIRASDGSTVQKLVESTTLCTFLRALTSRLKTNYRYMGDVSSDNSKSIPDRISSSIDDKHSKCVFYDHFLGRIIEARNTLTKAQKYMDVGNHVKAKRLLDHALSLEPDNSLILLELGRAVEASWRGMENKLAIVIDKDPHVTSLATRLSDDIIQLAYQYCNKAYIFNSDLHAALECKERIMPIVEEIDQRQLNTIDNKMRRFYSVPENHSGLRKTKFENYFNFIYHSNAIEGNSLTLAQTRSIIETRLAVGGKSLLEQNEVLGLDAALRYLNSTLLHNSKEPLSLNDILELHRRVLTFVDPEEAGHLRRTQVFVADHVPPPAESVEGLMAEFVDWLQSSEVANVHPIEVAALAHWKLVHIHPFYDGNGRTARLLMNYLLMRAGYPPAIVKLQDRPEYYQHLQEANYGDVKPFIRFIASCTERSVDEYLAATLPSNELQAINEGRVAVVFEGNVNPLQKQPWLIGAKCLPSNDNDRIIVPSNDQASAHCIPPAA